MKKNQRRLSVYILAVAIALCSALSGCKKGGDEFPSVAFPEDTSASNSSSVATTTSVPEADIYTITVASPYSDTTVRYLAKLYYCKTHDMMGENTGNTISLDYLDGIDPDFIVHSVLTPVEGASVDTVIQWNNDNNAPDVFLTSQVTEMKNNDLIIPINDYLADNPLLSSGNVFFSTVEQDIYDGLMYAVPYYSSVVLLVGNTEYIPSSGKLPYRPDILQLRTYLEEIAREYDCIPLSSGRDLIPYINSAFNDDRSSSFMLYDEYRINKENALAVIGKTLDYINGLYDKELTADYTAEGSNPVFSRSAGIWAASSSEITDWDRYYPAGIYLASLPSASDSGNVFPMTTLYSFCVNKNTANKDFAADFAAFIALDSDARMLTDRLEYLNGFLPSINSSEVWDTITNDPVFGQVAGFYYRHLDKAVFCPWVNDKLFISVSDYLASYKGGAFDPEACYGTT